MHELSIVYSIVESVEQSARDANATTVTSVKLQIGPLSGVSTEALRFAWDLGIAGTLLEGASLIIDETPALLYCAVCSTTQPLTDLQTFRCPVCQVPSNDLRQGRELDILSITLEVPDSPELIGAPHGNARP